MSTNEIELTTTEISPKTSVEIDSDINSTELELVKQDSIVEGYKKEYSIVGDGLYASVNTEEAPQWLLSIIDSVIDAQLAASLLDLGEARTSILAAIAEVEVAKNQYDELINIEATIDGIITSRLTTLNASVDTNRADIINLDSTKVTEAEALTIAANKITTELNTGAIKAQLDRIDTAHADLDSATTGSINTLTATLTGQNTEIEGAAAVTQELLSYVGIDEDGNSIGTGILADIELLQKQNDGVIETITGTYDVITYQDSNPADGIPDTNTAELITTVEPYASWIAAEEAGSTDVRLGHIGDVYIKYSENTNGTREYIASYKFIRTAVDTVTPLGTDSEGFTWALIIDQAAQDAYTQALSAYDLADNKRRVFTEVPYPPYDEGDLWANTNDDTGASEIFRCVAAKLSGSYSSTDWLLTATDDTLVNSILNGTESIASAVIDGVTVTEYIGNSVQLGTDNMIHVFSGTIDPSLVDISGYDIGDLYYYTNAQDVITIYRFDGADLVEVEGESTLNKLQDLSDGKRAIYTTSYVPTDADATGALVIELDDLWIPTVDVVEGSVTFKSGEVYKCVQTTSTGGIEFVQATRMYDLYDNLQDQVDGKVDTYYQETVPFADQVNVGKDVRAGDYWYCSLDNDGYLKGKIYLYEESANGSNYDYTWTESSDISKDAFDLADGKRRVFVIEPTGPYDVGDLWSRNIDDSDQLWIASIARDTGFLLSEWYLVSTDDKAVTTLQTGLEDGTVEVDLSSATVDGNQSIQEYVSGQIDDIINVFSGTDVNAQTGMQQDDIFIEKTTETGTSGITVDVVNTYRYNGTSWDKIGNNDNLTGLADLADGKRTIFAGSTIPTGAVERDLWIPEAGVNEPYVAGEVYQFLSNIWTLATKYTEDLNNFVDVVNTTVASLRNQIDSQIVYYIFDNVVDANNDGYVGADESTVLDSIKAIYTTAELKEAATGNITYFKDTTNGYWYQNSTDSWLAINDTSIMQALREAEEAKDIANNKITLYSAYKQTTAPAVTELWLDSSGTLTLKEYTTSWTTVQTNTGDLVYLENPDEDEGDYAETPYRWNGSSWVINRDGAVVANAQAITDLGIELDNGTNTWADADSQLQQTINGKIEGDIATVESKFEYNSTLNINGNYYNSGFGLTTNYHGGTGTELDPYLSEFWVNADTFRVVNPTNSSQLLYSDGVFRTYNEAGDYSELSGGELSFYKAGNSTSYKYLRNINAGTATNGSTVTIQGFYGRTPQVMVSAKEIISYSYPHNGNTQQMKFFADNLAGDPNTGIWSFRVNAFANLPENTQGYANTLAIGSSPCGHSAYAHSTYSASAQKYSDIHVRSNSGATSIDFEFTVDTLFAHARNDPSVEDSSEMFQSYDLYTTLQGYNGSNWVTVVPEALRVTHLASTAKHTDTLTFTNITSSYQSYRVNFKLRTGSSYELADSLTAFASAGMCSIETSNNRYTDVWLICNVVSSTVTEHASATTFTDTNGVLNWIAIG